MRRKCRPLPPLSPYLLPNIRQQVGNGDALLLHGVAVADGDGIYQVGSAIAGLAERVVIYPNYRQAQLHRFC